MCVTLNVVTVFEITNACDRKNKKKSQFDILLVETLNKCLEYFMTTFVTILIISNFVMKNIALVVKCNQAYLDETITA